MRTVKSRKTLRIHRILKNDGRSLRWLARQTGYSPDYISRVDAGEFAGAPRFWKLMEAVLGPLDKAA